LESSYDSTHSLDSATQLMTVKKSLKLLKDGMTAELLHLLKHNPTKYQLISDKFGDKFP